VFTFAVDSVEDLVGGLGPNERVLAMVPAGDEARILIMRSRMEVKRPRRMAWRSMMPNQISTRFSHDPEVAVKWTGSGGS
jgi:hypothetical protein